MVYLTPKFLYLAIIIFCLNISCLNAEILQDTPSQTVKGRVVSFQTQRPVIGATVMIPEQKLGSYTKNDGNFKIEKVPAGRHIIRVSAIGYETQQLNIVVTSGKELILNLQLQESFIQIDTVTVVAAKDKFTPINDAALVSSTIFTIDDVQRFAGSRMDPARMAQNFAGVLGADDRRNDIVIRGGSPTEVLWRIDGLDIPNPNHYATQGATGGPISALNPNLLDNSDFLTGAFPSEYIGKMSGVFDIRTRKGNDEIYEFMANLGFNGVEAGAQGPIPLDKGTFIANYRYSFLDFLDAFGVDFGFAGIPRYQDGVLKLDFSITDKDQISVTGFFGISDIDIKTSKLDTVWTGDFDVQNGSDLFTVGATWQHLFSEKSYGKLLVGTVYSRYRTLLDSITTDSNSKVLSLDKWFKQHSVEGYHTAKYSIYYSPDKAHYFTAGVEARLPYYSLDEERYTLGYDDKQLWNLKETGNGFHSLSFINWNWRVSEEFTANIGLASQYNNFNSKFTLEPRLGLSWKPFASHSFNFGYGIFRQSLPLLTLFYGEGNKNLDYMQSVHYVAGYSYALASDAIIKFEGYYKDISKAPIDKSKKSSFSFLNAGQSYGSVQGWGESYINDGVGRTYGSEISFIKNFSDGFYITTTASLVRQQYKGSDNIWRFGVFDNIYILNVLAGYEFILSPTMTIELSGKYTTAGGTPYTPVDIELSNLKHITQYKDSEAYSLRGKPYSRFDIRIDFRNNLKDFSIISYISFENLLNTQNEWLRIYNFRTGKIDVVHQLGFFFYGGIMIEF